MAPKAAPKKPSKKAVKPSWMSEETFLVSQNLPALVESLRSGAADKDPTQPTIPKSQARVL